jgi:2-polyprenyl-3-methyl-5-hydroxy-6-metoxy-1,4-benzoquinol methylase
MEMKEYLRRSDSLSTEEAYYEIPFRKEFLLSVIGYGKRVLDVGCLGGQISSLILQQNNEVWGVELNRAAAAVAETRGVRVKVADVEEGIPFEAEYFDVVNAGEVLEHLYDTKHFMLECNRVLKPEGSLLMTVPNLNSWDNRVRVLSGKYLSMAGAYPEDHYGNHIRIFNQAKIRELCRQTGFEIRETRGVPALQSLGKLLDLPLGLVGRLAPSLSKLLMYRLVKR